MLVDFNDSTIGQAVTCDLCIIGSGAAGIAIAREFLGSPTSVSVLEGGASEFEKASQEPYQSRVIGLPHKGTHQGRARVLGGTTTLWAGQALPLFGIDFECRDWVPSSGWPMTRAELEPYYLRAEAVMQIAHRTYGHQDWPKKRQPLIPADGSYTAHYSQFAKVASFSDKYRQALADSTNVTVLTHANVVRIEAASNCRAVQAVQIKSLTGRSAVLYARAFVVCCGGIDSARLLLASDAVETQGIGNSHDRVGRYFQDHPTVTVPIVASNPVKFANWYDPLRVKSGTYAIKLSPTPAYQREHRVLNMGAEVYYADPEDEHLLAAKRLVRGLRSLRTTSANLNDLKLVAGGPGALLSAAYCRLVYGHTKSPWRMRRSLLVSAEQEPNPDSRICLHDERDSLGMRRAAVDWRLTASVSRSIVRFVETLATHWKAAGIGDIMLDQVAFDGRERGAHGGFADVNHHIGTTRMGRDPRSSVVDPECRVHGYANLYVASSSVFPTGGFSNPTLTVLALSLRVADRIKAEFAATALRIPEHA